MATFVYFKSGVDADVLKARLAEQGVLIRGTYMDYNGMEPRVDGASGGCFAFLPNAAEGA